MAICYAGERYFHDTFRHYYAIAFAFDLRLPPSAAKISPDATAPCAFSSSTLIFIYLLIIEARYLMLALITKSFCLLSLPMLLPLTLPLMFFFAMLLEARAASLP